MPEIRLHKRSGNGRVFINGQEHWVGRYGSPEAKARYAELIAAFVTSGGESVEAATAPPPRPAHLTAELTVAELAMKWLKHIEQTRPDYKRSSLWNGAIAASRAVRPFATMAVGDFGSRALLDVQKHLIETPILPRHKRGRPATGSKPKYRTRRYINDVVGRIRQMFHWGVLQELVPDDRVKALEIVPALTYGATKAKESKLRQPVRPSIVRATLPYLTPEVADLIWFMRLTGCRPSEAGHMKLSRVRDREHAVWRYVPRRHKTTHKGKQRHIPIGPQAQAIVLAHTAGREPGDYVFSPQLSVPARKPRNGVLSMEPRKVSPRVGKRFTKDSILRAVTRAIAKANEAREKDGLPPLPHWTPYQLRYTRLREIRKQLGREAARAVAGHSRATMTDHYAPANWGRAAKAAKLSG
jgi:integrase